MSATTSLERQRPSCETEKVARRLTCVSNLNGSKCHDNHGHGWVIHLLTATFADYMRAGPLLMATDHRGMSNGKPLRIFFSNVSVKLAGSDKWIDAQAVGRICHKRTPCTEELRESQQREATPHTTHHQCSNRPARKTAPARFGRLVRLPVKSLAFLAKIIAVALGLPAGS
jgi:hypothetical protein